jgi:hypothetical protein
VNIVCELIEYSRTVDLIDDCSYHDNWYLYCRRASCTGTLQQATYPNVFNALYGNTRSEYNTDITHYNTSTVVGNFLHAIESTDTHCGLPDVAQAVKICVEESVARGALTS